MASKVPVQIVQAISDKLVYPRQASKSNLEGQVYLRLCVCNKESVRVVELSATNPILGVYVKKELAALEVLNPSCKDGQVFLLKINFDMIEGKE